jgi:acetate kinase
MFIVFDLFKCQEQKQIYNSSMNSNSNSNSNPWTASQLVKASEQKHVELETVEKVINQMENAIDELLENKVKPHVDAVTLMAERVVSFDHEATNKIGYILLGQVLMNELADEVDRCRSALSTHDCQLIDKLIKETMEKINNPMIPMSTVYD